MQISTNLPPTVSTTNLTSGKVGLAYSFQLVATGGVAPYSWEVTTNASTVPGLTLSSNGVLSGVPLAGGQFTFTVILRDSTGWLIVQEVTLEIEGLIMTLAAPPQSANEISNLGFKLTLSANEAGVYSIQRTSDFKSWEDIQQIVYTNNPALVTDTNSVGSQMFLYRAVK